MVDKKDDEIRSTEIDFAWQSLTWDDLQELTDSRSVERGRSYQRSGRVRNLARLKTGGLVADVVGTQLYSTAITMDGKGRKKLDKLETACSCPIGLRCKHVVAVILAYLEALENNNHVPFARLHDLRLPHSSSLYEEDHDEKFEGEEELPVERLPSSDTRKKPPVRTGKRTGLTEIKEHLDLKSKPELVSLLVSACRDYPQLKTELASHISLNSGDFATVIRDARKELLRVTSEEAWYNAWEGIGNLPDYSTLKSLLETLAQHQQYDVVIELGRELIARGTSQVDQSHDEGETACQVSECISTLVPAIENSSLGDAEKIIYVIEALLLDDYDLCDALGQLLDRKYKPGVWATVAEHFRNQLDNLEIDPDDSEFHENYRRERLGSWIGNALDSSGQREAATNLFVDEARITGSYQRAVNRLIALEQYSRAVELAEEGLEKVDPDLAGIIDGLEDSIARVASLNKNHNVVTAIAAQRFVDHPDVSGLEKLLQCATMARCKTKVEKLALRFLETGVAPTFEPAQRSSSSNSKRRTTKSNGVTRGSKLKSSQQQWPFPPPPFQKAIGKKTRRANPSHDQNRPHYDVLLQLAIKRKNPKSVLKWYDLLNSKSNAGQTDWSYRNHGLEVAQAISREFPDRAIELYCSHADELAARTSTSLYPNVVGLLKEARKILTREKRKHEFAVILETFYQKHSRKRRLIELLASLDGKPIVKSKRRRY